MARAGPAKRAIAFDLVNDDFAHALGIWSRCLHARLPWLVWPWL
ncbi:hypothetical protein [Sphingopyxis flava]|nr:hypothetical protein [Sphingopyxis flava]